MPPRPFPYALRVGTDICSVSRLRAIISRPNNGRPLNPLVRFIARVLTYPERKYFWHRFGPPEELLTRLDTVSQFLAGRFAAKEACRKACTHLDKDARGFQQIIILPIASLHRDEHQSSPPRGLILDKVYDEVFEKSGTATAEDEEEVGREDAIRTPVYLNELEGQLCEISISHDGGFATAVAIVPSVTDNQTENHISSPPPLAGQSPQGASVQWNRLLAETTAHEISAETEDKIVQAIDARMANLQRRNNIVTKIREFYNREREITKRERELVTECTLDDRQRMRSMLTEEGLTIPQIDEGVHCSKGPVLL
ncbi:hypothetical protein BKA66DRAFT_472773 [Pyrenochaeta sp. MPI-SDFR-AT-0127]|nr:hypothetical protein BKA66DRAFT_472773 [Pyrenochaeta sp. MPI-SDFR-AT-0127]